MKDNLYIINFWLFILTFLPMGMSAEEISPVKQKERPKVGLVLSGGGAKGFAHVGVLKILEEYNIPIDYIGGTSIGSIIGGLYAVGYTADELEKMIVEQDWEALFTDAPERTYMPVYEKVDQGRYLVSMHFKDYKLEIPNYAITNNGIIKLFSDLTLGYHGVNDFDHLPTPFLCITADLITGEEVVLDQGFLPEAMAASMAIPGVFPSIDKNRSVYVDGGVRNNFPVDHIRAKGADIIIGIDVGAGMQGKEQVKKLSGVVDQLTTMLGSEKFKKNRQDCDIYIKPDIDQFSTADFTNEAARQLLELGQEAGESHVSEFESLAKQFEHYSFSPREIYVSPDSSNCCNWITDFYIQGSRLDDADILGIMGVSEETHLRCQLNEMDVALKRLHASMKFSSIRYKLIKHDGDENYSLYLNLEENSQNSVNFGAHYNTQDDVALLFNGTFNRLLLRNSRLSFDLKLSDLPRLDLHYNINRGSLPGVGINYGYRRRVLNSYSKENLIGSAKIDKNFFEFNTNSIINHYFTVGLGARYERFDVSDVVGNFPLTSGTENFLLYRFFFEIDTEDKSYYPTHGARYASYTSFITDNGYELNGTAPEVVSYLAMNRTLSLTNVWALQPHLYAQVRFTENGQLPIYYQAYAGGVFQANDMMAQIPFWGLKWGQLSCQNVLSFGLENRFHIADKHYVYANVNALSYTPLLSDVTYDNLTFRIGGAIGYSFDSLVGPMEIFFSVSNESKINSFVNIGYYF